MNDIAGDKILKIIKDHNITQKEFAEKLNVTPQAVSKWVRNLSIPDIQQLKRISEIFNVSIDSILDGELKSVSKYRVVIKRTKQFFILASVIKVFSEGKQVGIVHNDSTLIIEVEKKEVELKLQLLFRTCYIKGVIEGNEMIIDCRLSRLFGSILVTTSKVISFESKQGVQRRFENFEKTINISLLLIIVVLFYLFIMYL